ncbi:MAG: hypothetical protein LBB95_02215, partial [Mycoplasmataceae bacterium]|nr:hypothetical protein [Mycoplasmataceae bacterium]
MKKISAINLFKYTCLGCIASGTIVMAITYIINFIPSTNNDQKNNYTSEVTWDGAYHLGVDDNPDFVASPTQQSIAAALHDQFSLAFPNTNDFTVQITNEFNAICIASPYSKIYSGSTNITWDVEQKLNLPSSVLLSPFYTQTNTMYENEDVTEQMVFDKLVSEYSNSLNINQLLLTQRNDITGEFTVQPKADSTVY